MLGGRETVNAAAERDSPREARGVSRGRVVVGLTGARLCTKHADPRTSERKIRRENVAIVINVKTSRVHFTPRRDTINAAIAGFGGSRRCRWRY